jgi:hypothetical protein
MGLRFTSKGKGDRCAGLLSQASWLASEMRSAA